MTTETDDNIFTGRMWKRVALDMLRRDGIARMPAMPPSLFGKVIEHFQDKQVWNAHVVNKATEPPLVLPDALKQKRWPAFSHKMEDVVTAPFLLETAIGIYDVAHHYFDGEPPRLYSMNAFWTQPASGAPYKDTHDWHRDGDDRKQLVMFMYGTDIEKTANGAHMYQKGTHRKPDHELGYPFPSPPYDAIETIVGPAGTIFLADTFGFHMGLRPNQPRLLLWCRYGVSDPPESYKWDQLVSVNKELIGNRYPRATELQEAIKLVVQ